MSSIVQWAATYKPLIDFFQALLTPVIACIAGWIAYQQVRNNRRQFQLARYDRQRKVYFTLREFLSDLLMSDGEVNSEMREAFQEVHSESHFIFDDDEVSDYLDAIATKSLKLSALYRDYKSMLTVTELDQLAEKHSQLSKDIEELKNDLDQQFAVARELFKKHLKLT